MRCKKHPGDLSSGVGVCASCLRERFRKSDSNSQYLQQPPPPLIFPRSVSPYVARRKSDDSSSSWSNHNHHHNLRFYSTPQVGPTYTTPSSNTTNAAYKKQSQKFSLFSNLFRFRSDKFKTDSTGCRDSIEPPSSSSPSWFSMVFSGRRRKQSRQVPMEYSGTVSGEPRQRLDRGMSPARGVDSDKDCENCDRSPSGSGCSPESSPGWKRTAAASGVMRRGKAGQARNVSGLAFCLSPLVRASPKRNWNQKGGLPPELGYSGEVRAPVRPHLSTAASFCANRSRKLADFGRVNHNR
ncbi:hypothetical protein NC651_006284 [Populus alba x Populus x berolinensis]|nr:hypothetical protein NC651_006284 [Populus alba x Populus x berolinensis]